MNGTYETLGPLGQGGSTTTPLAGCPNPVSWTPDPTALEPGGEYQRIVRAALYVSGTQASDLDLPCIIDCARHARMAGFRVVTAVAEDQIASPQTSGAGAERLWSLIDRMEQGQFDVILAHTGKAVLTIGKSPQFYQDATDRECGAGGAYA